MLKALLNKDLIVAPSKIPKKWCLLTRVSRSHKMVTVLALVHSACFARIFLLFHHVFFFGLFSFYRCRVYVLQISMCIPQRWEVQQTYKIVRKTVH